MIIKTQAIDCGLGLAKQMKGLKNAEL